MKLSIIIPVYNEQNTILEILKRVENVVLPISKEIIIVDDCSTDGTRDLLKAAITKHTVIWQKRNQGKGAALQTGLGRATGDYVVFQDADLEYDPTDLGVLLQPILTNQAAVVIGSRSLENNSASRIKWRHPHPLTYIGNLLIVWLIKVLYQRKGNDFFACYKIMPRRLLEDLKVEARDFSYDIELLCKLFRKNIVITTAPIHYNPRTFAEGKKITYSDGLKALWAIGKWRFKKI